MRRKVFLVSFLVACLLAFSKTGHTLPLDLQWEAVTSTVTGEPLASPVMYRLYRKTSLEDFKPIAVTKNTRWTWLVPSIGRYSFYVTAFNNEGESGPSNTVHVHTERWPHEDDTIPTATPDPRAQFDLKIIGRGFPDE